MSAVYFYDAQLVTTQEFAVTADTLHVHCLLEESVIVVAQGSKSLTTTHLYDSKCDLNQGHILTSSHSRDFVWAQY
jgi:hypothetical protein